MEKKSESFSTEGGPLKDLLHEKTLKNNRQKSLKDVLKKTNYIHSIEGRPIKHPR